MLKQFAIVIIFVILPFFDGQSQECQCTNDYEKSERYSPPLTTFIGYNKFSHFTNWKIDKAEYDRLFFRKLISDTKTFRLTVFSSNQIKLINPSNSYTLNLTPCENPNIHYEIRLVLNIESNEYRGMIETDQISIEISNSILSIPNQSGNTTSINFISDSIDFSSKAGITETTSDVCTGNIHITNSDVSFTFDKANIYSLNENQVKSGGNKHINLSNYPLFREENINLISDFEGLLVKESKFLVPFKNSFLNAKGEDLLINNNLIAGLIVLKYNPGRNSKRIQFNSSQKKISTSKRRLKKELRKSGLNNFKIEYLEESIKIYFLKTISD
ncbi:hypothetical protein C5O00_13965 [Pukyongia salina]|uniref:Uncharacterized protein n=2 Tax=Pukyongia salina TaxID=2094025 RepID=A0A2S0HZV6_9FLAO|nr:hypothetical protein C5O00_13965 [Pukyongia salina]